MFSSEVACRRAVHSDLTTKLIEIQMSWTILVCLEFERDFYIKVLIWMANSDFFLDMHSVFVTDTCDSMSTLCVPELRIPSLLYHIRKLDTVIHVHLPPLQQVCLAHLNP